MTAEGQDFEGDIIMSYVAVEAAWRWGYGVAHWALRGPKWVIPVATLLNSSSTVCHAAHSSSITYLHADRCSLLFFGGGEGKCSFFIVLCEVVDDEVGAGLVRWSVEAFHNHGGQRFDISR